MTTYPLLPSSALRSANEPEKTWLWKGFLAAGEATLLTSLWKSGKSTLISVLLSRMSANGELAGLPIAGGRAVIISEEPKSQWAQRSKRLAFGDHLFWFCRPFKGKPTLEQWLDLLAQIIRFHQQQPIDLVVIDTFSNLTPIKSENEAGEMLKVLLTLQPLMELNIAILIAHHPRKGVIVPGQAARGSGSLSGFVDIIIEMQRVSASHLKDRRRRLRAYSRHDETPTSTIIELTQDGTDYNLLPTNGQIDLVSAWPTILHLLENADTWQYLSRNDIQRLWPEGFAPPTRRTLFKWLSDAHGESRLERRGEGTKSDPYTYCLPGMTDKWQAQFIDSFNKQLENLEPNPAAAG